MMEEVLTEERQSDQFEHPRRRRSADNGCTWSEFEPVTNMWPYARDDYLWWAPSYPSFFYDRHTRLTLAMWLRQQVVDGRYYNHTFVRTSPDLGATWSEPRLLRYEEGDDLDPQDPLKRSFLESNGGYFGQKIIHLRNGRLVFPVCSVRIPQDAADPNPRGVSVWDTPADSRNIGSLCFIGRLVRDANNGTEGFSGEAPRRGLPRRIPPSHCSREWTAGKPVWLPRHVSTRGLMEPDVAELKDGRVLVIWRGSNAGIDPADEPGRKWFSVSTDGGLTLSPVQELKYDDGSRFFSPSSYHLLLRQSVTRKLYWVGNISRGPTSGNEPRYPLVIAEVDERVPALKKDTATVIDDRGPDDPARLALSNFSLLEDRETHELLLFMTRVGDREGDSVYRYRLRL